MELSEFLAKRLDEDQAMAERNSGDRGLANGFPDYRTYSDDDTLAADDYIDHFGPARMLREVAAKRAIVARHHPSDEPNYRWRPDAPEIYHCVGCGYWGDCDDPETEDINHCPELLALAMVYDGHPEFDPAWRVE